MAITELRPLSLGELLDRTFTHYRRHFWVFVGIMAVPQLFAIAMNLFFQGFSPMESAGGPEAIPAVAVWLLGIMVLVFVYFIVYAVSLGATTLAVSDLCLDRVVTVRSAYQKIKGHGWRVFGVIVSIMLRLTGCVLVGFFALGVLMGLVGVTANSALIILYVVLALAATVVGAWLATRMLLSYSVAIPALLLEGLTVSDALKRSSALTQGYRGRVVWISTLTLLVGWTASFIFQGPFFAATMVMTMRGAQPPFWLNSLSVLAGGIGQALTGPLLTIALALFYYDLRVRKEGLDLQIMMATLDQKGAPAPGSGALVEPVPGLQKTGVLLTILLVLLTLGLYFPIWFMTRRRALNSLQSPEKLGYGVFILLLIIYAVGFTLGVISRTAPTSPAAAPEVVLRGFDLLCAIILVVQSFKVRRILLDHFGTRRTEMFSAAASLGETASFSAVATFFFSIWYLQYKINRFLEAAARQTPPAPIPGIPPVSP